MVVKCDDVFPWPVAGNGADVSAMKPGEPFRMTDSERSLYDGTATEQAQIAGTPIDYWLIDPLGSEQDALYGEPVKRFFEGPYRFYGIFQAPSVNDYAAEEGLSTIFEGSASIPRKFFEDARAGHPGPGDVLRVWDLPMYLAMSTPEAEAIKTSGYFFDILNVNPDGYVKDTPTFVRYSLRLKRRTTFTPERRLRRP